MPTVSQVTHSLSPSGARVYVTYRFTDHVGGTHDVNRYVSNTTDHAQALLDLIPDINARMIEQEVDSAVSRVESGEDPVVLVNNPDHSTTKRLTKALLYYMMRERDPLFVILLEPLILDIRANFTAVQMAAFLDLTAAQVTKLNGRINNILDNKADFLAFENDSEDFGDA